MLFWCCINLLILLSHACLPNPFFGYSPGYGGYYAPQLGYGAVGPFPRVGPWRSEPQRGPSAEGAAAVAQNPVQPRFAAQSDDTVRSLSSLNCQTFREKCLWSNTEEEELNWTTLQESPQAQAFLTTLDVQNLPDQGAGALVSTTRNGWEGGQLVSDKLPCLHEGLKVTATAWRSRLGPSSEEPKLQVCSKNINEDKYPLINCNDFEIRNGVPMSVDVPAPNNPSMESRIVFYGNNFVSPQGGAIFLQDIGFGGLEAINAVPQTSDDQKMALTALQNSLQTNSIIQPAQSARAFQFQEVAIPAQTLQQQPVQAPQTLSDTIANVPSLFETCLALSCNPSDLSCRFWRSAGNNRWEIGVAGRVANPLTGIHLPPGTAQKFLVAPFFDTHISSYTLVSEVMNVPLLEQVYFCFYEYFATEGFSLSVCTDKMDCFYKKSGLSMGNEMQENKKWNIRCAKLPPGTYELRVIAENSGENKGEVGFLPIRLSRDSQAYSATKAGGRMHGLVTGLSTCEAIGCDGTVGPGGSPDENGETTLDSIVMDGENMQIGAVANLRGVSDAAKVAWAVMNHTTHSLLVGSLASDFAKMLGFPTKNLSSDTSLNMHSSWKSRNCQPNFWRNVSPDPTTSCGPYTANKHSQLRFTHSFEVTKNNHDTIGMVVVDENRKVCAGTSSNGAAFKIPGRVGDSPIAGAGAYASEVGGAAATGDGDVMMRFLPTFYAVSLMELGTKPTKATIKSIRRILKYYPKFKGAVIAANTKGNHGAACANLGTFEYTISVEEGKAFTHKVVFVACLSNQGSCSVATYRYNSECRQQYDNGQSGNSYSYHHDPAYTGFLGADVKARVYSEHVGSSEYARSNIDLQCLSAFNCTWKNTDEDYLDWVLGEGHVDPTKLELITGSKYLPGSYDNTYFILASNPQPSSHDGQLISLPIGCQQSEGILSFRYWRSRARTFGNEPKLDICTRHVLEEKLENCMTVTPTDNHTILASIPPIFEPFVIILRGYNFENEPEGGLILLDEIEYFGEIDPPESCSPKNIDNNDLEPFSSVAKNAERLVSGETAEIDEESQILSRDVVQQAAPTLVNNSNSFIVLNEDGEAECRTLTCLNDDQNAVCDYQRAGYGAKGEGYTTGWRITSTKENRANKLTGIHMSPNNNDTYPFLVANFVGFRRTPVVDRYVLEASEYAISDTPNAYLSFKKFLSAKGLLLSVCEDGTASKCFWNVYNNSIEPFGRKWTKEIVLLPDHLSRFFIVAWQDASTKLNFGQIGLSEIGLYSDSQAVRPLC
ncbi:unnamed protein product [Caenorhabditis bovis]|uniref:N(4)-(beta-N-acetylglucosaminyl)-L-asparaginase n=1 Tax=Caenorhabditis bovis TaxID=2654633 RepID=A0A8S1EME5_9PELO|nr:unnamed protein product [Caenorhabditis bovis]